jgi:type II secretory pathway pseudopilin PulG
MRRLVVLAVLCAAVASGVTAARAQTGAIEAEADRRQRRAAQAIAAGDHGRAAYELGEAFWLTRNPNFIVSLWEGTRRPRRACLFAFRLCRTTHRVHRR